MLFIALLVRPLTAASAGFPIFDACFHSAKHGRRVQPFARVSYVNDSICFSAAILDAVHVRYKKYKPMGGHELFIAVNIEV
eukprot:428286-Amphidinium_carterae.1